MLHQPDPLDEALQPLLEDAAAHSARDKFCELAAGALQSIGQELWVLGSLLGPDRVSGDSPFGFGSDGAVGLAALAQIGGELADGTIALLRAGQRYGAAALIRQLVEVEYLAAVFAGGSTIAADWMRTTRDDRLKFWSPTKLRQLASREFLPSDYWTHCEFGGHPTPRALALLPEHSRSIHPRLLWVDFAGHLSMVWHDVLIVVEREELLVVDRRRSSQQRAQEAWRTVDGLYAALQSLGEVQRHHR